MQGRPKILFATSEWLLPDTSGGQQRALGIARLLSRIGDVSLANIRSKATDGETLRLNRREFDVWSAVTVPAGARPSRLRRLESRLRYEFDPACLETGAFALAPDDRADLLRLMSRHDVAWIQGVGTANACRISKWPHSVLDTVDVHSNLYRSMARSRTRLGRRWLDHRLAWQWKRRERLFTERFDVVTVCSESERKLLGGHPRVRVIPNAFSPQPLRRSPAPDPPRIGFIGTFEWAPNSDGVEWFLRDVWPAVKRQLPSIQWGVVGRDTGYLSTLGASVAGLGWLEDAAEEIATWSAMIVPIRFGAGTRVKMAEGFARKCPIVATTIGAFGFGVRDGEECLLADDSGGFASACVRLVRDPQLGREIAKRAHQRFLQEWTWDAQEEKVRAVVRECLARDNGQQNDEAAANGRAFEETLRTVIEECVATSGRRSKADAARR